MKKDYFQGKRRGGLKKALYGAGDGELRELQAEITARQERIAQLELELLDMRAEVAAFEHEMDTRVGLLKRQIERLEKQLEEARRHAARRAQWGERADSPDIPEDVVEQFRKTWKRAERSYTPSPEQAVNQAAKEDLRTLYRKLAKRFHPDLVTDPEEKKWRELQMAKVNQAYAESNIIALSSFQEDHDWAPIPAEKSRADEIADLHSEISRLDGLIAGLENDLRELVNSESVKWMLDVSIARKAGQDLLRRMEKELMERISYLQHELASVS